MDSQKDKGDLSVTTFSTVVVRKDELLKTLEANREKHNSIFDAAVSGYWIESQQTLEKKKKEFDEAVAKLSKEFAKQQNRVNTEFAEQANRIQINITEQEREKMGGFVLAQSFAFNLAFNAQWPLKYPENHLEDYDRVIDLLKFSIADKVELSSADFDAYVRNNWSWRNSFLGTNSAYVGSYFNGGMALISGCSGALACSGYALDTTGYGCFIGGTTITGGTVATIGRQLSQSF